MHKTTMRVCCLAVLAISSMLFVSTHAGSLEPPPGPVSPTRPPDKCFDNTGNRFVDCGNGTIKDTETELYWLKNADCFLENWANANIKAKELAHGQCGLTDGSVPGDWRLPTVSCPSGSTCEPADASGEFVLILAPSCGPPYILDTSGNGCWSEGDPFSGVQSQLYWSGTTNVATTSRAWFVILNSGIIFEFNKTNVLHVWPVRRVPRN